MHRHPKICPALAAHSARSARSACAPQLPATDAGQGGKRLALASGLAVTAALCVGLPVQAAPAYAVRVLAVPATATAPGSVIRTPRSIDRFGRVFGQGGSAGVAGFFVFDPATGRYDPVNNLLPVGVFSLAYAMNNLGQVAGAASQVVGGVAIRNADGSAITPGVLPGDRTGRAQAINDNGAIAGVSLGTTAGRCGLRAFAWSPTEGMRALGSLVPLRPYSLPMWTEAWGINNRGQVVGTGAVDSPCGLGAISHAFVSTPTGLKDLHVASLPPAPGSLGSTAYAINDAGIAVGNTPISGNIYAPVYHAVVWDTTLDTATDLGNGALSSTLYAINAGGQVVGNEANYAVIGQVGSPGLVDLNTLVPGKDASFSLQRAVGVNDAGQILVAGVQSGTGQVAFVLTPTGAQATPMAAPSALVATAISSTQIRLRWQDNALNETVQILERCVGVGCASATAGYGEIVVGPNITTVVDSGLAGLSPGVSYSYRIRTRGPQGESARSAVATAVTFNVPPVAPSNLQGAALPGLQISLNWTDNAFNETNMVVYRCQGSRCSTYTAVATLPANTAGYTDVGLKANTVYRYKVQATNSAGGSPFSAVVSVTALP